MSTESVVARTIKESQSLNYDSTIAPHHSKAPAPPAGAPSSQAPADHVAAGDESSTYSPPLEKAKTTQEINDDVISTHSLSVKKLDQVKSKEDRAKIPQAKIVLEREIARREKLSEIHLTARETLEAKGGNENEIAFHQQRIDKLENEMIAYKNVQETLDKVGKTKVQRMMENHWMQVVTGLGLPVVCLAPMIPQIVEWCKSSSQSSGGDQLNAAGAPPGYAAA